MIILGIDPGTASTGWGTIEIPTLRKKVFRKNGFRCLSYGCIKTPVGLLMTERLLILRNELRKIIKLYQPDCLVMEQLFFGANSKTAISVGQARGVVMVTAAERKIPLFEYQGLQIKLLLTGYGRANKNKIQESVKKILNLRKEPKPDDAADALAVCICHAFKNFL